MIIFDEVPIAVRHAGVIDELALVWQVVFVAISAVARTKIEGVLDTIRIAIVRIRWRPRRIGAGTVSPNHRWEFGHIPP